jgi:hypothetical protein
MTFQLDVLANGWLSSFPWRDYRRLARPAEKFLSHTTIWYYLLLLGMARRLVFRYTGTTGHRLVTILHDLLTMTSRSVVLCLPCRRSRRHGFGEFNSQNVQIPRTPFIGTMALGLCFQVHGLVTFWNCSIKETKGAP